MDAPPDATQYLERFAADADLVDEAFLELRVANQTAEPTLWFGISALRLDVIGGAVDRRHARLGAG